MTGMGRVQSGACYVCNETGVLSRMQTDNGRLHGEGDGDGVGLDLDWIGLKNWKLGEGGRGFEKVAKYIADA